MSKGAELLVSKLFNANIIPKNMFSTYYDLKSGSSYIYFGDYETAKLSTDVKWFPLQDTGFWQIKTTDVQYNGKAIANMSSAIIDSGTSLSYFPKTVYQNLLSAIGGCDTTVDAVPTCKCSSVSDFKPFVVNFNGTTVSTDPKYWVFYDSNKKNCVVYIGSTSDTAALLGDSFMRGKYIVHDVTG
jgi:Eukaryotic aspartyl protease